MKTIVSLFFTFFVCIIIWVSSYASVQWSTTWSRNIPVHQDIIDTSLTTTVNVDLRSNIQIIGRQLLNIVKRILMWIMLIYVVYIGIQMIISMGSDDEKLSAAKRQLWYTLVALVFINIPATLFNAFYRWWTPWSVWENSVWNFDDPSLAREWTNIFFNRSAFEWVTNTLVSFLEILIFAAAIFMITLTGIQLLVSRWKEERVTEAKNKILYSILAIIFVGIIEAWKSVAFSWSLSDGRNLFESLANLALFFAAPVAIFFLTLAGYYYITSNWDEERAKKAKNIIINTVIATVILLASYTFLLELSTFL